MFKTSGLRPGGPDTRHPQARLPTAFVRTPPQSLRGPCVDRNTQDFRVQKHTAPRSLALGSRLKLTATDRAVTILSTRWLQLRKAQRGCPLPKDSGWELKPGSCPQSAFLPHSGPSPVLLEARLGTALPQSVPGPAPHPGASALLLPCIFAVHLLRRQPFSLWGHQWPRAGAARPLGLLMLRLTAAEPTPRALNSLGVRLLRVIFDVSTGREASIQSGWSSWGPRPLRVPVSSVASARKLGSWQNGLGGPPPFPSTVIHSCFRLDSRGARDVSS